MELLLRQGCFGGSSQTLVYALELSSQLVMQPHWRLRLLLLLLLVLMMLMLKLMLLLLLLLRRHDTWLGVLGVALSGRKHGLLVL